MVSMRKLLVLALAAVSPLLMGMDGCGGIPLPRPTPKPTPTATPAPTPTPQESACPKELAPGAEAYLNDKPYGQGWDATVRVRGDKAFCQAIHGDVAVADCHLEGWPKRSACEMELIGGCPIWQYRLPTSEAVFLCQQQPAEVSCDHFGSVTHRDDPATPNVFEGEPKECGKQRDGRGDPVAGFFIIAHGRAEIRACRPDGKNCGPFLAFDH